MSRKWKKQAVKRQNQSVANVAPITAGSGPLHTSAETLRYIRQNKHNPLPYFKPEMLSRVLDSFEHGRIREAVLLWEKIAERDDMLASVKPKREKDVSQLDMQVVVTPDSGQAGLDHRAVLQRFWKTCRAVNSYDRNERGGFRRLIKQMMTAISYRYAAHHIIWDPQPDGELRATFEFVPLWLFENTTGKLRYLKSMSAITGEELDDSEWMVADRGAKVSSSALMERLNLPAAKDGEDALQPMAKGPAPAMPADLVPGGLGCGGGPPGRCE